VPEKVKTFEIGYRTSLFNHLYLDANAYYSYYKDFIGYKLGVDFTYDHVTMFPKTVKVYRVAANADGVVTTYGSSIGLQYFFKEHYIVGGNYSLNVLQKKENQDQIIPAYNTPKNKFNVNISGRDISTKAFGMRINNFGFNINYKWVQGFTFEGSPQFTGYVPTYDMVDAQINKRYEKINLTIKLGCSNLFGLMPLIRKDDAGAGAKVFANRHLETYGGPYIGRLTYISLLYELSGNRLGEKKSPEP
jgi:iron complex outermembrane receptor protein